MKTLTSVALVMATVALVMEPTLVAAVIVAVGAGLLAGLLIGSWLVRREDK